MMLSSKIGIFTNRHHQYSIDNDVSRGGGVNSAPLSRKVVGALSLNNKLVFNGNHKTITPIQLNKHLGKNNFQSVILDLRDSRHYQNGHIKGARSTNCTTKLMSKKTLMDWKRYEYPNEDHYILYDQHSDLPAPSSPQMVLVEYLLMNDKRITFLQGGYDEFKKICDKSYIETDLCKEKLQSYNYSPTNACINHSDDILNATASQIFSFMFLGNERDSSDLDLLVDLGVTHILNVTSTSPFYFKNLNKFKYQRLPACDNHMQNLRILYNEAFNFIDEARHSDGKILIHCWAGVSRSPSIVIAYLLKNSNCTPLEILKFVQSKRKVIAPNIHFMGQLEKYYLDLNQNLEKRSLSLSNEDLVK